MQMHDADPEPLGYPQLNKKENSAMNLETILRVLLTLGLLIVGGWFTYGGVQLLGLGGSLYYLGAGILMLVSAWFVSQRSAVGVLIYALLSGLTLVWALFEVGFAFWLLLPRLAMPLGILLVMVVWALLSTGWGADRNNQTNASKHQNVALGTLGAGAAALIYAFSISGDFSLDGSIDEANSDMWLRTAQTESVAPDPTQWRHYGNTQAGTRFVSADQINTSNVSDLEVAWTYQTGVTPEDYPGGTTAFAFQATPIKVDDTLYVCAGNNAVHALDPETGEPKWVYDPKIETTGVFMFACRGVSYHED
jgi:quinate dehydrogenase (quinone)